MAKELKRIFVYAFLLMVGMLTTTDAYAFKDFSVIVNNQDGTLLTAEEQVQGTSVSFGVAVAEDGTVSRVAADDASAVAVISGKYHSDHGMTSLECVVAVEGGVKVTFGNCTYSSRQATITDADGNVVSATITQNCWKNDRSNVTEAYYAGGATTLTIKASDYCPFLAVETSEYVPEKHTINFSMTDDTVVGTAPATVNWTEGDQFTLPLNRQLFKEGYTLTAWNDGTADFAPGAEYTPKADVTFTPVFTANTVALADRTEAVTIKWDFQRKNGAPILAYQGTTGIYVAQAQVNGETIDVKLDFDTTNGKLANANWTDWAQMNAGTIFTIPSAKGAVVSMEAYSEITTTTIDGQTDYAQAKTISYTIASGAETIDIVIGDGSYYRYIQTTLPVVESAGGASFDNVAGTITWPIGNEATPTLDPAINGSVSLASVSVGSDLTAENATYFETEMVKYTPVNSNAGCVEGVMIEYRVKAAAGITFQPTNVSYNAVKVGTDNATYSWAYVLDGVQSDVVKIDPKPDLLRNNGANSATAQLRHSTDITADPVQEFSFRFYISDCANNKNIAIGDVVISGIVNGTAQAVEKFAFSAMPNDEAAGTVNIYPVAEEYEAGSEITLTAIENFGYDFVNWTDAEGNVVSTDTKFVYTLNAESHLTANFVQVNTYALNLTIDGGANDYMITFVPSPTEVDGKMMYEAGTKVTLTAASNEILTFTNWDDGTSSSEKTVTMDADVDVTVSYAAIDFIAGWDFYKAGNSGRVADFAAADNDADQFLLVSETDGSPVSWLDKSQMAAGGYEGKPAAVNWRTGSGEGDVGHYYWKTMVNAEAFTDIKVQFEMLYNYNSYTTYNVEYSLDDETYTKVGSVTMNGVKNWTFCQVELPAEANNQSKLFVRWTPDKTSSIDGSSSANDGNSITNVYFTGTAKLVDDGIAPVLVSSVPAEGATGASANGKVVLTFDEKVKVAEGATATLADLTLTPIVSGKTVIFEYKGLDYSTDYTFRFPANSVSDLTDNYITNEIVINFSTLMKPKVEKKAYDFVVPDDGAFEQAIAAANARADKTVRYRIFVKKGAYSLPASAEASFVGADGKNYPDVRHYITASNISIIGEDRDATVIDNGDLSAQTFAGQYGTTSVYDGIGNSDVLQVSNTVSGLYMEDITIKSGIPDARGRNLAVQDRGTKSIYKNVCLHGYQDTWTSNNDNGLYYFEGGRLRGRTDYLCGKGDAFFNEVNLVMCEKGGYLAVPSKSIKYGYVFKNCTIDGEKSDINGNYTLGRPWGEGTPKAYYINTTMNVQPSAIGWSDMGSDGYPAQFAEYNSMTSTGTVIDLAGRKTSFGANNHPNVPYITAAEAEEIGNMANMYGDWVPTLYTEQASAPTHVVISNEMDKITWDDNDYVLLWAVCKDGNIVAFTIEPFYEVGNAFNAVWSVRAANEMGGLGEPAIADTAVGIQSLSTSSNAAVVSTRYYNAQGIRVDKSFRGTVLRVETLADGTTRTTKIQR